MERVSRERGEGGHRCGESKQGKRGRRAQMWGEEARDRGEGGHRCGESKQGIEGKEGTDAERVSRRGEGGHKWGESKHRIGRGWRAQMQRG